jgi:hypothetical protein
MGGLIFFVGIHFFFWLENVANILSLSFFLGMALNFSLGFDIAKWMV